MRRFGALLAAACLVGACGETAKLPLATGVGPSPQLLSPNPTVLPTVRIAKAIGWPDGRQPVAAPGLVVSGFAAGLDHPRWLYVLPNGDVLVAETNAPVKAPAGGIKGYFMRRAMIKAGAAVASANRIRLLRDADGDGVAEIRTILLENLNSPFGMALVGERLYVANTDAVVSFPYAEGETEIRAAATQLVALPAGAINHHWTKNLLASADGSALYVSVGSNSNVAENGIEAEDGRAAIWRINLADGSKRLYATGLRNPNGMAFEPITGMLWTVVNERDELGSDLVPDYLTSVREGGFYGWPYSYYGSHVDARVTPARPELVAHALAPDYALGAHTAALGLAFSAANALPARFHGGMFVGRHGSWNRDPPSGYDVIFVPFTGSQPHGLPIDVLGGFLSDAGEAYGRPVGVAIDAGGALLVADDVGNTVWRVTAAAQVE